MRESIRPHRLGYSARYAGRRYTSRTRFPTTASWKRSRRSQYRPH